MQRIADWFDNNISIHWPSLVQIAHDSPIMLAFGISAAFVIPCLFSLTEVKKSATLENKLVEEEEVSTAFAAAAVADDGNSDPDMLTMTMLARKRKSRKNKTPSMIGSALKQKIVSKLSPLLFPLLEIYHRILLKAYYYLVTIVVLPCFWHTTFGYYAPKSNRLIQLENSVGKKSFLQTVHFVASHLHRYWISFQFYDQFECSSDALLEKEEDVSFQRLLQLHTRHFRHVLAKQSFSNNFIKITMLANLFLFWGTDSFHVDDVDVQTIQEKRQEFVYQSILFFEQLLTEYGALPMDPYTLDLLDRSIVSNQFRVYLPLCNSPTSIASLQQWFSIRLLEKSTGKIVYSKLPLIEFLLRHPCQTILSELDRRLYNCMSLFRPTIGVLMFHFVQNDPGGFDDYELQIDLSAFDFIGSMNYARHEDFAKRYDNNVYWWQSFSGKGSQEETRPERWVAVTVFAAIARLDMATPCLELVYRLRNTEK